MLRPPAALRAIYRATYGRRRTLTILLLFFVISLVVAFASSYWLPFRLAYVLAFGVIAAALWTHLSARGLHIRSVLDATRVQAGQSIVERIEIVNRWRLPRLWLEVETLSDMPGHRQHRAIMLAGRAQQSWAAPAVCSRRGLFTFAPVTLRSTDPFDLFHATRRFGEPRQVLVYPRPLDLPGYTVPPANVPGEGRFRRPTYYVTPNAAGLRDYAPGDSLNRIHWLSTVRTGRLMVKTFELDPASHVWVVLDLDPAVQAGEGDESTVEYGVVIAASVIRHFLAQNRSVGALLSGSGLPAIEPDRGNQQVQRVLEALAVATPKESIPLTDLLLRQSYRWGRHTTLIVISSSSAWEWVGVLRSLRQRGVRAAAILLDPQSFGSAAGVDRVEAELRVADLQTDRVRRGDNIPSVLAGVRAALGGAVAAEVAG